MPVFLDLPTLTASEILVVILVPDLNIVIARDKIGHDFRVFSKPSIVIFCDQ